MVGQYLRRSIRPRRKAVIMGSEILAVHTGCGPIKYPGWVNVDIELSHAPDVVLDVTKELLSYFGAESVDYHINTHSMEHYAPWPEGPLNFLQQALGILKPGGIMRISVPSIEISAKAYAAGSDLKFLYAPTHKGYIKYDCPAERLIYHARAWDHIMLFDMQLMTLLLKDAGFTENQFWQARINESLIPNCPGDRYPEESLIVEIRK